MDLITITQELNKRFMAPLPEFYKRRIVVWYKVELLSANHKVSNSIFSLNFYQKDAVGDNREPANYDVYFVDASGKKISDVQKIIADKRGDSAQEGTFRCMFNLKSQAFDSKETYYLVIEQENSTDLPERIEFQIDIAFAADDFRFFG